MSKTKIFVSGYPTDPTFLPPTQIFYGLLRKKKFGRPTDPIFFQTKQGILKKKGKMKPKDCKNTNYPFLALYKCI